MKTNISQLTFVALLAGCAFTPMACGQFPAVKATIEVVDQDGKPVKDAKVGMGFWGGPDGTEHGSTKSSKDATTPASGIVEIEGRNAVGESGIIVSKSGYYEAWAKYRAPQLKNGRWEPWNGKVRMQLKEIRNPIPMYVFTTAPSSPVPGFTFPKEKPDGPVGFDFFERDFIAPFGKGKVADVSLSRKPAPEAEGGAFLVMRFENPMDGIAGPFDDLLYSKFVADYEAPINGYNSEYKFENRVRMTFLSEKARRSNEPHPIIGMRWCSMRLRSRVDENGKLQSCHYGKIIGWPNLAPKLVEPYACRLYNFSYYINPTPNSRNLEWDTKTNLFEGVDRLNVPEEP